MNFRQFANVAFDAKKVKGKQSNVCICIFLLSSRLPSVVLLFTSRFPKKKSFSNHVFYSRGITNCIIFFQPWCFDEFFGKCWIILTR